MDKQFIRTGLIVAAAAAALSAAATCSRANDLTFSAGATTDYVARGSSQTNHQPSYSLGVDYTNKSGLYVGSWTENVDFGDGTKQEVDLYGGYRTTFKTVGLEYGIAAYNYRGDPGDGLDMEEAHVTASRDFGKWSTAVNVAYSPNYFNLGSRSVWYEARLHYNLTPKWSLGGSVGYQTIDRKTIFPPYSTYNIGATYALTPHLSLDARYTTNDLKKAQVGFDADDSISFGIVATY